MSKSMNLRSSSIVNKGNEKSSTLLIIPSTTQFKHTKLPLLKEVIGLVLITVENEKVSYTNAVKKVTKILCDHWTDRNIYTKKERHVETLLLKYIDEYRSLKRTVTEKQTAKYLERCNSLNEAGEKLFDIYCEDKTRREALEAQYGVPMLDEDRLYLKSMRSDRSGYCDKVDSKWHKETENKKRRLQKYSENQNSNFECVSSQSIDTETEDVVESKGDPDFKNEEQVRVFKRDKHKIRTRSSTSLTEDEVKSDMTFHVRDSKNKVRNEIYQTFAELDGHGFSYHESQVAIKVVANRLFGCNIKLPIEKDRESKYDDDTGDEINDCDTLPTRSAIRQNLKKIHAYSLGLIADRIVEAKTEGATITHATDSTTRKRVGTFAPSGIHVDREEYLPLPTINIASETTKNIADGIRVDFKMLEAASRHTAEDLYACVDLHMTDSTAHNKGIAVATAEILNREDPAGQLFCNPHTALGFDRGMKAVLNAVETGMNMENIFNAFLLNVDIDQKRDTVSLTYLSWVLSLFGPDLIERNWNYHGDFKTHLKRKKRSMHLFQLKDARFALLSKSAAIACFHWEDFSSFLDEFDYVTNKLACLVKDAMKFEYILVVLAVVAAFGVHVITPFFVITKSKATHSELQIYFQNFYDGLLNEVIDESFFMFTTPSFHGASQNVFEKIIKIEYSEEVISSVSRVAQEQIEDCITLANLIRPKLAEVLGQQRGKYYGFGKHPEEFYVFDQAMNVDKAVTHNLELERQCGDHDHRLEKKPAVSTVSRGNVLKRTLHLRDTDDNPEGFRKMGPVVQLLESIESEWKVTQEELRKAGLSKKEAQKLNVDNRKLSILERLKKDGGPFSNIDEIDAYLMSNPDPKSAQKRFKDEIIYARDTSKSLPRCHHLFKIMKSENGKRRVMDPNDFADNLKTLLGNASKRTNVTMSDFRNALLKLS